MSFVHRWLFVSLTLILPSALHAQDGAIAPTGRADQIEQQRLAKARTLDSAPPAPENSNGGLGHLIHVVPINFEIGGLGPGAGPAVNSVFRQTYRGRITTQVWGHLAVHYFYAAGTGVEFKHLSPYDLAFALEGSYANSPQLEYYGPGPNSSIHNRTDYRREDTLFNFRATLHQDHTVAEACRFGELLQHVGPGTNDDLATTQSKFGPAQAPGIDMQSDYLIGGCSIQLDLRDFSNDPHKGTYAAATFDRYYAQDENRFSFYRPTFVAEQFIPFFNRKRVIALRAKTELSFHSDTQVVPFYLQPTLGSDTDLRGYRRYRFYDENSISLTAEYRWEISTGFDMALFVDGGNVFHRPGNFELSQMKGSAGFGLRFKNQSERKVIARLDTGFSREGFQVWLKVPEFF